MKFDVFVGCFYTGYKIEVECFTPQEAYEIAKKQIDYWVKGEYIIQIRDTELGTCHYDYYSKKFY